MVGLRKIRLIASCAAAAALLSAAPANAWYVITWSNGGQQFFCDDGRMLASQGDTTGTSWVSHSHPGEFPC